MIEFPLKTKKDIKAYDRSVRVTRAARGLPPAMEFPPRRELITLPLRSSLLWHGLRCETHIEPAIYHALRDDYEVLLRLPRMRYLPCFCGAVLWIMPPAELVREMQIRAAEDFRRAYETEHQRRKMFDQRREEEARRNAGQPYLVGRFKEWDL